MRVTLPLFFVMIFVLSFASEAQDSKEHKLQVFAGFNDYANKDQLVSPFVYTDINYPLHLGYEVRNSEFIRSFEINYFYGTATTKTDNIRKTHAGFIRFGYLRSIFKTPDNLAIYAGGRISAESLVDQASFATSRQRYLTNSSGYFALSSGITANVNYQLTPVHSFSFIPYVSLLGYIYRPGYSLYHHESFRDAMKATSFSSYGNFLNVTGRIAYTFQLSERMDLSLNYNFSYLRYSKPFEIRVLQNSLLLGVGVKL